MSYRCHVCKRAVPPGTKLNKMNVFRKVRDSPTALERLEIQGELWLCGSCRGAIADGVSLGDLLRKHRGDEMKGPKPEK